MRLYTAQELRLHLAQSRQRPLPPRTFRYWKKQLGVYPDKDGFYYESDLALIKEMIREMKRGLTIRQFLIKRGFIDATRSEQVRSQPGVHPIDVAAEVVA